jgi:hypothetical protein
MQVSPSLDESPGWAKFDRELSCTPALRGLFTALLNLHPPIHHYQSLE